MQGAGSREAFLTADYNAEMIEQIARWPRVRDRALFVGGPEDIVDAEFGPGLPRIRDWTREHFQFPGYTYHFDPADYRDRESLRQGLGYRAGERVILVSVGGTTVGRNLLRKCAQAFSRVAPRLLRKADARERTDSDSAKVVQLKRD